MTPEQFIDKWSRSDRTERQAAQEHFINLCQMLGEAHLHRYLAEFDFRYNRRSALGIGDKERAAAALKGIAGKRLTYRRPDKAINA